MICRPVPSTFSIVAYDPNAKEWGIGVQSKFLAVGAVVPWAQAGVGACLTTAIFVIAIRATKRMEEEVQP